jgi:hypothetical protein
MGTKFLQQYGGLLLFLGAAVLERVTFNAETPLENLPKLAIAAGVFVLFEAGLFVALRLRAQRMEALDALNALLGVLAVSMAFLTEGLLRLVGGVVWLGYQLLEGRLEERISARRVEHSAGSGAGE